MICISSYECHMAMQGLHMSHIFPNMLQFHLKGGWGASVPWFHKVAGAVCTKLCLHKELGCVCV